MTLTVNVDVPGAVGVPTRSPLDLSESPGGSDPAVIDQLFVALPDEVKVVEYGVPALASGRLDVVIEIGGGGGGTGTGGGGGGGTVPPDALIVIANSRWACAGRHQSADGGFSSLKLTQNDQLPACVGVPLTRPLFASANPGGGDPPRTVNWYGNAGPQPPAPVNVKL